MTSALDLFLVGHCEICGLDHATVDDPAYVGPLDEVLAAFDAKQALARKRIEAEWNEGYDRYMTAQAEENSLMTTISTRPKNRVFGEGLFDATDLVMPTGIVCRPLPIGPSYAEADHESGYTLGRDGENVDLAGRSGAFIEGFYAGQDDKARGEMANGYRNLNGDPAF